MIKPDDLEVDRDVGEAPELTHPSWCRGPDRAKRFACASQGYVRAVAPGSATITASRTTCGEALLCTGSAGAYEVTIVVSAASAPSSALPVASPEVVCDPSQLNPTPSLTCRPALVAALAVLAPAHPPIIREEFRFGGLCPPGAPCVAPLGDQGIVIIDFARGQPEFVYVSTAPGGVVAARSPARGRCCIAAWLVQHSPSVLTLWVSVRRSWTTPDSARVRSTAGLD